MVNILAQINPVHCVSIRSALIIFSLVRLGLSFPLFLRGFPSKCVHFPSPYFLCVCVCVCVAFAVRHMLIDFINRILFNEKYNLNSSVF
jgi:hypothetical protein